MAKQTGDILHVDKDDPNVGVNGTAHWQLRPPQANSAYVFRRQLIERLRPSGGNRLVTVVAPAGYGKTTLLTQWADCEHSPVAWVSLQRIHNDPIRLLQDLLASLRLAGLIRAGSPSLPRFAPHTVLSVGVSRLVSMLATKDEPATLILDHAESLSTPVATDLIAQLAEHLSGRIQLVIASRTRLNLPLETWRAQGNVVELTLEDLRMTRAEATEVLRPMGLTEDQVTALVETTEGWPVLLSLAGLAMQSGPSYLPDRVPKGDDRFIADYVRKQIVGRLSKRTRDFLIQTSILDALNGQLCDHVLDATGSSKLLISLEDGNLPIAQLDRERRWYRCHALLRDVLHREFEDLEPDHRMRLHQRASEWYESNGLPERAIAHAQACNDSQTVARIVGAVAREVFIGGKPQLVINWLDWLDSTVEVERYPKVTELGSLAYVLVGDAGRADRWLGLAMAGNPQSPIALLSRALGGRGNLEQMRQDARMARDFLPAGSEWTASALLIEALPSIWEGDHDRAERLLAEATDSGGSNKALGATTLALAERSLIASTREDWAEADYYAGLSLREIRDHGLEGFLTSGLGLVMAAWQAHRRGDTATAKNLMAKATNLRPILNAACPGIAVQTLLEIAAAHLRLTDVAAARTAMREAENILRQRPNLGTLGDRLGEMKGALEHIGSARVGAFSLTKAELRLLPLLSTHLTFPQIGERLFISRHTVKTEAMSIYRKLGASSRSEAIERAREAGFLNH